MGWSWFEAVTTYLALHSSELGSGRQLRLGADAFREESGGERRVPGSVRASRMTDLLEDGFCHRRSLETGTV